MAERLSTGLRNYKLGGGSDREAFKDFIRKIYSGPAPASADDAVTGVLLAIVSKASGAVLTTNYSTPSRWSITIPGTHAAGTYKVTITIDATAYTVTYDTEEVGAEGHASNDDIARGLARKINHSLSGCPQVFAIAEGANSKLYVQSKIPGIDLAIVDGGGTVTITTFTEIAVETAANTIRFAKPSNGAMSKNTDVWSGLILVSGVAGYFRDVQQVDDSTSSSTALRYQGSVSTSGAELNLSSISLVAGTTLTIDTYSVSQPAE
jgi:hypothetical protein